MAIADESAARQGRRARNGRRSGALAASVAVHLVMGLALLGSASGRPVGADGPGVEQGVMAVTLVSRRTSEPDVQPETAAGQLRPLLARFDNGVAPEHLDTTAPATPSSRLNQLLAQLQQRQPPPRPQQPPASTDRLTPDPQEGDDERSAKAAGLKASGREGAAQPGAGGGLWGLVSPCWDRIGGASRVRVTLEVALDGRGRISRPPRIIRAGSDAADEPRLRAEAQALAALAACAPQADWRLANRVYRLEFNPRS
jgi:hypothetical protein